MKLPAVLIPSKEQMRQVGCTFFLLGRVQNCLPLEASPHTRVHFQPAQLRQSQRKRARSPEPTTYKDQQQPHPQARHCTASHCQDELQSMSGSHLKLTEADTAHVSLKHPGQLHHTGPEDHSRSKMLQSMQQQNARDAALEAAMVPVPREWMQKIEKGLQEQV